MSYNKKIAVQEYAETEDTVGNMVKAWRTVFRPWAEVTTLVGKEYYAAAQVNSENDTVFKIRYSSCIAQKLSSELRVEYGGRFYDVKHIDDVNEQHRQLVIRTVMRNGGVR